MSSEFFGIIVTVNISISDIIRGEFVVPTYGYRCDNCDHTFEVLQKMSDDPITECEKCKGEVRRILYPVGIVFKGSGFHINDYKKPDKGGSSSSTSLSTPASK